DLILSGTWTSSGALRASGGTITVQGGSSTQSGVVEADDGGLINFNAPVRLDGSGALISQGSGQIVLRGDLLGDTRNSSLFAPAGTVLLDGAGTASAPQRLEVMGQDLGNVPAGFVQNFAYGPLTLSSNTVVRLVDLSDNSTGTGPEAIYVDCVTVPAG